MQNNISKDVASLEGNKFRKKPSAYKEPRSSGNPEVSQSDSYDNLYFIWDKSIGTSNKKGANKTEPYPHKTASRN